MGLLAAATLAYEILLVRVFAIEQFHHFAYMAIGVAMLGFGVGGTAVALVGRLEDQAAVAWFKHASIATAVALLGTPALVSRIPIDPTQLTWNWAQWLRIAIVYAVLAVPFATGGLAILLALARVASRPGRIYGASFLGSAAGAGLALAVLWIRSPTQALALPAVLGAAAAVLANRLHRVRATGAGGLLALGVACLWIPIWEVNVSPYKGLPQVEAYPNARRRAERSGPLGWVVAVEAPALRHAPGLSLAYRGPVPPQTGLFLDGGFVGAASNWRAGGAGRAMLDWLPTAAPYAMGAPVRVLVVGAGGGIDAWSALEHGARAVTTVELVPDLLSLTLQVTGARNVAGARARWVVDDARSFIERDATRYGLITMPLGGAPGTAAAGVHALNEDFLHTVEAYQAFLERLTPDGALAITRWLTAPPRENVRVVLTAAEALRRLHPDRVAHGIAILRSWGTATTIVKPAGFTPRDIAALREWANARHVELDWYPGAAEPTARYHELAEPTLFSTARAAAAGREAARRFADEYPFDVAPATDARPYPHHFLRRRALRRFFASGQGSWLPFAEWGYLTLIGTLGQSILLALLFLLLPTVARTRAAIDRRLLPVVAYFTTIGLAYLTAEIALIQQLGLLLGHPVYAVSAVLVGVLVGSGVGSVWSDRLAVGKGWQISGMLAVVLAGLAAGTLSAVHVLQAGPLAARALVPTLVVLPTACLMGMPFPMGIRRLTGGSTVRVAWAWAANGFASVVAAPFAALMAVEAGSPAVLLVAGVAYGIAAAIYRAASAAA